MVAAVPQTTADERSLYSIFADLFDYPSEGFKGVVQECIDALLNHPEYPNEAIDNVRKFQEKVKDMDLDEIEENYSYTFEFAPDYTLDLGHHLYDGFKRSTTLLTIKTMYRKHGFPIDEVSKGDLPDKLTFVLRFIDMVGKDSPLGNDFRADFLIKALEKIDKAFEQKGMENLFSNLERALYIVVDTDVKSS